MPEDEPLACRVLCALAQASAEVPSRQAGMSLPRLGKRLGQGASVLLRELALVGDAVVGGVPGPGWVRLTQADGRWWVQLTPDGLAQLALLPKE